MGPRTGRQAPGQDGQTGEAPNHAATAQRADLQQGPRCGDPQTGGSMIDREGTALEHLALHVDVHQEDGSYWAEVRELPGCFASGDTAAELIESVEEAVSLYLAPPEEEAPPVAIELAGLTPPWRRISPCRQRSPP